MSDKCRGDKGIVWLSRSEDFFILTPYIFEITISLHSWIYHSFTKLFAQLDVIAPLIGKVSSWMCLASPSLVLLRSGLALLSPLSCKPCDLVVRLLDIRHVALVIAKQPASLTHVACSDLSWLECMIDDFASNSNPFHVVCSSMFLCSSTTTYVASCLAAKLHNDFCAALVYNRRRV